MKNITFISAGAGSGKTYRLASELEKRLTAKNAANPSGVIGTTFTKLAAAELRERVRQHLNERGFTKIANQMSQAMLGTVNSVCGQLLSRFAFEAGLSPNLKVIEEAESKHLFNLALEQVLTVQTVQEMNTLAIRLSQVDNSDQVIWKDIVKSIVNCARSNNQSVKQIKNSGIASADLSLAFFPKQTNNNLDANLHKVVEAAIHSLKANIIKGVDKTGGTQKYLELLQDAITPIKLNNLAWSDWVKLSKSSATKKSKDISEGVNHAASYYEQHPRLHADIRQYCEQIFCIAAGALAQFQDYKKIRGLIDFTDQEHLLFETLQKPEVQEVLKDELDFMMVDEFQDTSPLQLALFLRLAKLAKKVIWVGDVKQAIYGFRGSDPELMQAILKHLENNGGKTDILETSWRSRPELVNYVNEIFVPAFANTLPKERISLKPKPNSKNLPQSAVEHWQLVGKNITIRAQALAQGIQDFITSDYKLTDKDSGHLRTATYGDVAILSRTNENLNEIATALSIFNIPISRSQIGLLKTPEAALVLAALRFLSDPYDSLSTAEIICLTQGEAPETWLQLRLNYIANDLRKGRWGEEIPLLKMLAEQRMRIGYLSPSEIMSQAIHSADIRHVILSWQTDTERAEQRLLNIEQLLTHGSPILLPTSPNCTASP